ncbi:hypothetical protein VP01_1324g1 [Puccinia sorghi]|uniref:Uncharacterized protein n=1 Tax=Puccinia sorghi TaxID=27349 RepID=A0A0L6VMJ8_9BASI|nr:hypothetical protein VP01_1324g1 [Puccinia sorghi]
MRYASKSLLWNSLLLACQNSSLDVDFSVDVSRYTAEKNSIIPCHLRWLVIASYCKSIDNCFIYRRNCIGFFPINVFQVFQASVVSRCHGSNSLVTVLIGKSPCKAKKLGREAGVCIRVYKRMKEKYYSQSKVAARGDLVSGYKKVVNWHSRSQFNYSNGEIELGREPDKYTSNNLTLGYLDARNDIPLATRATKICKKDKRNILYTNRKKDTEGPASPNLVTLTAKKNFLNCLQLTCSILQPSCHPTSTLCTVTVNQSLVESILENGWSNDRSFLGISACQLKEVEQVFLHFYSMYLMNFDQSLGFTARNQFQSLVSVYQHENDLDKVIKGLTQKYFQELRCGKKNCLSRTARMVSIFLNPQ